MCPTKIHVSNGKVPYHKKRKLKCQDFLLVTLGKFCIRGWGSPNEVNHCTANYLLEMNAYDVICTADSYKSLEESDNRWHSRIRFSRYFLQKQLWLKSYTWKFCHWILYLLSDLFHSLQMCETGKKKENKKKHTWTHEHIYYEKR